jgi:hypothetical protein
MPAELSPSSDFVTDVRRILADAKLKSANGQNLKGLGDE